MAKKSWKKTLNTPIKPMKLDSTEFLLLAFVAVTLLVIFVWQMGMFPTLYSSVLGVSTVR